MKTITVVTEKGDTFECGDSDRLAIGGLEAAVTVPGDSSGNEYAHLENRDGHIWLVAAASAISVAINGKPVSQAVPVRDGDRVEIGSAVLVFDMNDQVLTIGSGTAAGHPDLIAPQPHRPRDHRPGRLRVFKIVLFGIFFALLLAMAFVFLATPISISVEPAPANLEVRGFPPPIPLRGRLLVFPGEYLVQASKPGYEPLMERVTIARGEFAQLDYRLEKLPGRISLYSQPKPAEVSVDGEFLGSTPLLQQKIAAGEHRLVLSAERYQDTEIRLRVEGLDREQIIRVELAPDWAPVTIRSTPPGASVQVDDEIIGATPFTTDILAGDHMVKFELDRYQDESLGISVVAGEAQALPVVVLTLTPGKLSVNSRPGGATVTVDGVFSGSTPLDVMLIPEVDHQIVLARAGYLPVKRSVKLAAAEEQVLSIDLPAEFGIVFVTTDPADTDLYVNGKAAGKANQRLRLSTRLHTLEFRKPGYQTRQVFVTPRAGVSKQLSVTLSPVSATGSSSEMADIVFTAEGQKLKLVEPVQFTMGASRREQGRRANENLRRVELTRRYYIGVKEVTNGEFRRFKSDHTSGSAYGRSLDLDDQPVVNVSWDDAVAYLNWLSEQDGLAPVYRKTGDAWTSARPLAAGYRLPTEAEWANAARFSGTTPRKYAWDGTYPPTGRVENFGDVSASGILSSSLSSYDDKFAVAAPVGSFKPNQLGLYDVGGNVAEWTNDYYSVYPAGENTVASDPLGPNSGRHRVIRGAGWKDSTISELRLSFRDYSDSPRNDVGFRIARYAK